VRARIPTSQEFARIAALERRTLTLADAEEVARELTPHLLERGARPGVALRPWQAIALLELAAHGGLFAGLPVGQGKTLISALAPVMVQAARPVLVVPAALVDKTRADFASYLGTWRAPNPWPVIVTREALSIESGRRLLEDLQPDLIMIDECDDLANPKSAAARRIDRYIVDKQDGVRVLAMSGTISRKSIKGYAHLLGWTLRDRAPIPNVPGELELWALVLDDHGTRNVRRPDPGPLGESVSEALDWYRERLTQTPGVVIVDEDSCDQPLTVRVRLAKEDPVLDAHYETFLKTLENPDGMPVSDPLSRWRFDGQLGAGLYLRYVPPGPPEEWRQARRAVAAFVRDTIDRSQHTARPLDTEAPVLSRYADHPIVKAWNYACATYGDDWETEGVWLSASTIESAVEWLRESDEPSIIWSGVTEFGEALATAGRLPYYGPKGRERMSGRGLHVADPHASLVASWHANKKGFNLQAWRRHLVVHPPQSAKWLEQIFGRTHRAYQDRPVVFDVLATSGGTLDSFEAAISEATRVRARDAMTQKILRAEVVKVEPRITPRNQYRWARRTAAPAVPIEVRFGGLKRRTA
jgi:hypothetical protein